MTHSREEVEKAFRHYYMVGVVGEDWRAWSQCFTDDAVYKDHYWGTFHGPEEIERFLEATMSEVPGVYTAMIWYNIDGDRVVWKGINWADNPSGGEKIGFESLQLMEYAGGGKFRSEEDWWIMYEMQRFGKYYAENCPPFDAEGNIRLTREDWGPWVDWARPEPGHQPKPSWLGKDITPIRTLRELDFGVRNAT